MNRESRIAAPFDATMGAGCPFAYIPPPPSPKRRSRAHSAAQTSARTTRLPAHAARGGARVTRVANPRRVGAGGIRPPRRLRGAALAFLAALFAVFSTPATARNCDGTVTWTDIVPDCLSPGDQYRILFVSRKFIPDSVASNTINSYNDWVQQVAAASSDADFAAISSSFKMFGSTAATSARDNTGTTGMGTGIRTFYFKGNKVADDYADLYDGSWDSQEPYDEHGAVLSNVIRVMTGSTSGGLKSSSRPIRAASILMNEITATGLPQTLNSELFWSDNASPSQRLYALSGVLIAPTTPTSAPADLTATPGDARLTITWTALPDTATGGSPVTDYNVRYRVLTAPPSGDWTDAAHDGTAATAVITGLVNDTAYEAQVQAVNAEGEGPWSTSVQGTPMATTTAARVNEVIVPELARALVSSTLHALTSRIEQAREGGHAMQTQTREMRKMGGPRMRNIWPQLQVTSQVARFLGNTEGSGRKRNVKEGSTPNDP